MILKKEQKRYKTEIISVRIKISFYINEIATY